MKMSSWLPWSKNKPEPLPGVTLYKDEIVTIASTSANAVIRQFTNEFAREMNEKADSLDRAIEADRLSKTPPDITTMEPEEAERDIVADFREESESRENIEDLNDIIRADGQISFSHCPVECIIGNIIIAGYKPTRACDRS